MYDRTTLATSSVDKNAEMAARFSASAADHLAAGNLSSAAAYQEWSASAAATALARRLSLIHGVSLIDGRRMARPNP